MIIYLLLAVFIFIIISQIPIFISLRKKSSYRPILVPRIANNDLKIEDVLKYAADGKRLEK